MKKSEISAKFRAYVRDRLSPTPAERALVSSVYESVQAVLGGGRCLQIGSYPRFTSITPVHDLDILYVLGAWNPQAVDPSKALADLQSALETEYENPTQYEVELSRQTHSITLKFSRDKEEVFSTDIVPAYVASKNEFGDDMYVVPEIAAKSHRERRQIVEEVRKGSHQMTWIRSDPRGYITVATRANQANDDFRKAVKLVKGWRHQCKEIDDEFPLKSFHLERLVTHIFQRQPKTDIFDAVFKFFYDLPAAIEASHIPDRADAQRNIDAYVDDLTVEQQKWITQARDFFLLKLENFGPDSDVGELLRCGLHKRASNSEAYLFDEGIPVLLEDELSIEAIALERKGGFRQRFLDAIGLIDVDRRVQFRLGKRMPVADVFKWKVKNDDKSAEPRGEITDHHTKNDPESAKYKGAHFVECYAIRNGVCIAKARQNVVLKSA